MLSKHFTKEYKQMDNKQMKDIQRRYSLERRELPRSEILGTPIITAK